MRITNMLPSSRFATLVGSIVLSGGIVFVAYAATNYEPAPSQLTTTTSTQSDDWKKALQDIQAQNPLNQLPKTPSEESVQSLLDAIASENVTDTVARSLFINLSTAKAQGLGADIPTQDSIIADATAKIAQERGAPTYVSADLKIVADSKESQRAYGNAFMTTVFEYPNASMNKTFMAVGKAIDYRDVSALSELKSIQASYRALTKDLASLQVPSTLVPLHLSIVNNISRMGETYDDMELILADPLRGLGGFKLFESLGNETTRVFTDLAGVLSKNGILFNKDEPGYTWNSFVP